MISVIMPAYNAAKTIQASINSLIAQTYEDWELIVIDDRSSDGTLEAIKQIAKLDSRIRYCANESNLGTGQTRNRGLTFSKGAWIAFLDSDDLWCEDKLEKQMSFIAKTGALITYTATAYINESGRLSRYSLRARYQLSYHALLRRNIMSCSSVMVHKAVMMPFPDGDISEDYAVWLQILKKGNYAYGIDEPLLIYRMSAHSKSAKRLHAARRTYNAYLDVGYGSFVARLLTLRYAIHSIVKRLLIRRGWLAQQVKSVIFTSDDL